LFREILFVTIRCNRFALHLKVFPEKQERGFQKKA
jgi:hypothetical protein